MLVCVRVCVCMCACVRVYMRNRLLVFEFVFAFASVSTFPRARRSLRVYVGVPSAFACVPPGVNCNRIVSNINNLSERLLLYPTATAWVYVRNSNNSPE